MASLLTLPFIFTSAPWDSNSSKHSALSHRAALWRGVHPYYCNNYKYDNISSRVVHQITILHIQSYPLTHTSSIVCYLSVSNSYHYYYLLITPHNYHYLHCPLCLLQLYGILTVPSILYYYTQQHNEEVSAHSNVMIISKY